jgi:hypothetical protein
MLAGSLPGSLPVKSNEIRSAKTTYIDECCWPDPLLLLGRVQNRSVRVGSKSKSRFPSSRWASGLLDLLTEFTERTYLLIQ